MVKIDIPDWERRKMSNLSSHQWLLCTCICVLCKGKCTPSSQDMTVKHRSQQDAHWTRPDPIPWVDALWTWQMAGVPQVAQILVLSNIPLSPLSKGPIHHGLLKQDVCLRPPSPKINNPHNLIWSRVEALRSHYFHIRILALHPTSLGDCGGTLGMLAQGSARFSGAHSQIASKWK